MIKASELRVGNLVLFDSDVDKITSIGAKSVNGEFKTMWKCDRVHGIEITPEILELFLTKVNDKKFVIEIKHTWSLDNEHTDYWFIIQLYEYYATGDYHVGWRPYVQKGKDQPIEEIFLWGYIETVHQLQNLYFSLTKQELEIKPYAH